MIFNTLQYAAFLPLVFALHWLLPQRARTPLLLTASYIFYGAWDYRFLGLLLISTIVDWAIGLQLTKPAEESHRKRLLSISVIVNLGILAAFKYAAFFVDSAAELLARAGVQVNPGTLEVILPVGISFYTFQSLAYTFDIYRRRIEPCASPIDFALFVAYFPQLVAGPIERAGRLIPQLKASKRLPSVEHLWSGVSLILVGLFKKVVLADPMARLVESAFSSASSAPSLKLAVGLVAFGIQVYGDFSGYSDIARGTSRLFGIELMHNFRQPYLSRNITEFWHRWHISLSNWLRDYLYVPLGGNRRGPPRTYINLMLTMLLGGLWHGAAWTFVVWGGLHGVFLAVHKALGRNRGTEASLPAGREWAGVTVTFVLVHLAWLFFRAPSFEVALEYLRGLAALRPGVGSLSDLFLVTGAFAVMLGLDLYQRNPKSSVAGLQRPVRLGLAYGLMLLGVIIFSGTDVVPFIYFQF